MLPRPDPRFPASTQAKTGYNTGMSNFEFERETPPSTGGAAWFLVGVLVLGLVAGAWFFYPALMQGQAGDLQVKLAEREALARADADAAFRRREAELAAEAKVHGDQMRRTEVAPSAFRQVVAKAGPAVVNISSWALVQDMGRNRKLDLAFAKLGEGSGVIVRLDEDRRGYIITNAHVVSHPQARLPGTPADRIGITLQSGRTLYVDVSEDNLFSDPSIDLAVVLVDFSKVDHVVVAEWGNSDEIQVGDWVVAIGSPFGLKETVTTGIVSAKGRANGEVDLIQTDAAINPGNSGGPLLDLKGRIIGINSSILTRSGGSEGIGFAIPSNTAKEVFEALLKPPHRIIRGYLGVRPRDLSEEDAAQLRIPGGAIVEYVAPGTPADEAGLQPFDVVLAVLVDKQRREVTNANELRRILLSCKPGQVVTLDLIRTRGPDAGPMKLSATIGELPALGANRVAPQLPGIRRR